MNKKGQYYILIALILIAFAFATARSVTPEPARTNTLQELADNFKSESSVVINNALLENKNTTHAVLTYAETYKAYVQTRSPQARFTYVLETDGQMTVVNYLDTPLTITTTNTTLQPGETATVEPQILTLTIEGIPYTFPSRSTYNVQGIFRQVRDGERRVIVV